ncbi:hypothetical protein CYMTET_30480 [Cymbomonas tetramitiformis]|uniref:Uncharacterized protein n=1 Tax=Cymbomonas tetramitiformis TaxID=36881 RepID=A0AAE0FIR0_9CHLO|nr:hypothetical protein CYMTET_52472 [Cymbomonas tetramitiformis]KAK3260572.1 hypothetical protein CYMTET_30480 [Cymbomonas tetramitiformis]
MAGTKRLASAANLDFPSPPSDTSDPVDVLFFYAGQCTENEAPVSTDGVREAIAEIEERGLPHDADRRKVLFGTLMVWRGVVHLLTLFSFALNISLLVLL